ncbi:MAG: hypothetical protein ACHP85_24090 [Burkholderiales bacterium]
MSGDPEAEYYQTVEEFFVSRRGDPLFLSNAEWNLVRKWRLAGLPLRVVLRGVRDALDGHAHGWSRERRVRSLAYCAAEVEAAGERWRRALALGAEPGLDASAALRGFARDLRRARGLGARAGELASGLAGELEGRADGSLDELTPWLAEREERLVEALAQDLGAERAAALEAEIDAGLARWRERMPARVVDTLRRESRARRLLEAHGLPRLSLFHLEAGGAA